MNLWLCDDWPCLGRTDVVGGQEKIDTRVDKLIQRSDEEESKQRQRLSKREVEGEKRRKEWRRKERHT